MTESGTIFARSANRAARRRKFLATLLAAGVLVISALLCLIVGNAIHPAQVNTIELDVTTSIPPRVFATLKELIASSLPALAGTRLRINTFDTQVHPVFEGFLTSSNLVIVQADVRSLLQNSPSDAGGTDITNAAIVAANGSAPPGAERKAFVLTDGFEDVAKPMTTIPPQDAPAFAGLHLVFAGLRTRPRTADLALLSGASVETYDLDHTSRGLFDEFRGRRPYQAVLVKFCDPLLALAVVVLIFSWMYRPLPTPKPPKQLTTISIVTKGGRPHSFRAEVGGGPHYIGNAKEIDIPLSLTGGTVCMSLELKSLTEAKIRNESDLQIVIAGAPPIRLLKGHTFTIGSGDRLQVSPTDTLEIFIGELPSTDFSPRTTSSTAVRGV